MPEPLEQFARKLPCANRIGLLKNLHDETIAAQAGGAHDALTGGVVPPISPATTYTRDARYALTAEGFSYGRDDNANVRAAENVLAKLENARAALLFPSGMAAIAGLVRTTPNGGSIVIQSGIYWGTTHWIRTFCQRREVRLVEIDACDTDALKKAVHETQPSLVWVETPSNPWLKTVDIAAAADICRRAGALLAVDSTAATPVLQKPLSLGADIVMHSATKAINGHSDVLAGVLATNADDGETWRMIAAERHGSGAILGSFEAWLLLRGMRTLPLRVERMSASALHIAHWLAEHPAVSAVYYPGLAGHEGHALAKQQMQGGFGGLLSFRLAGGREAALKACGKMQLFARATSLGGAESLVEHRLRWYGDATGVPDDLLRLSVGIEHADDLIGDLMQALK